MAYIPPKRTNPKNEHCFFGLPACGFTFESGPTCFIACSSKGLTHEIQILEHLLPEYNYVPRIAVSSVEPSTNIFCAKICSQIIQSHFCIALLTSSPHKDNPGIRIHNPNVHFEYGLMKSMNKYVIPFQHEDESLPFNVAGLDTVRYSTENFRDKAREQIEIAITRFSPPSETKMGQKQIATELITYIYALGYRISRLENDTMQNLYDIGSAFGFYLLDGPRIIYLGVFPHLDNKEITLRVVRLLRNLDSSRSTYLREDLPSVVPIEQRRQLADFLIHNTSVWIYVGDQVDTKALGERIQKLREGLGDEMDLKFLSAESVKESMETEYKELEEI